MLIVLIYDVYMVLHALLQVSDLLVPVGELTLIVFLGGVGML